MSLRYNNRGMLSFGMVHIAQTRRPALPSVLFALDEGIATLAALGEVNRLHTHIREMSHQKSGEFALRPETIVTLVGATRDYFCIRLANLFDKRKDTHSLKRCFRGVAIDKLEKHPITVAAIKARHNNIAHMGKAYAKWPEVDEILAAADLKELLEGIRIGILIDR